MTGYTAVAPGELIALIDDNRDGDKDLVCTTLTVELAQQLLERYTEARRQLRQRWVDQIAHWIEHPDPEGRMFEEISVGPDGVTIAGQHLMHAVIKTGKPVENVRVLLNRTADFAGQIIPKSREPR
jgi:hypothetical protein